MIHDREVCQLTMRPTPELPSLEVYMLGLVDFVEVQQLQRRIVYELGESGGATLILCEHPPTISIGRSGSRAHIASDDDALRGLGVRVFYVNRGGGCILHVPQQLAAYLAMPLNVLGLSVQQYTDRLHAIIVGVLEEFDLIGTLRPEFPGVFSGQSRIATVGVAVNRWIAYHGMTLNVGPYLELFDVLEEPGIDGLPIRHTSMESRRQRQTPMSKVRESVLRKVEEAFGLERHHLYTDHPQIKRKVPAHVYAPSPG
ncbi:MAG: lipoyl(octanoyl) transferase LipB [Isosphaeraceae bacterium]